MPLCWPSQLWHRAELAFGRMADSGPAPVGLAQVIKSQCVKGMFLTPALPLNYMVFLRNKNNNSNDSSMGVVQAWQKMGSIFMKPVF